jgi:hypothetical protein
VLHGPFTGQAYEYFVLSFLLALWGLGGWVVVKRRELPPFIAVRENQAVVYGILIMILCWGLALYGLIKGISLILGN